MKPLRQWLALGLLLGGFVSVLPLPFNYPAAAAIGVLGFVAWFRRRENIVWHRRATMLPTALATVVVAAVLPVKHLDKKVGPMTYQPMPLDSLTDSLRRDWRIPVRIFDAESRDQVMAFRTDRTMTRREVLEKLAHESSLELHIGYCGTGATFLFGAHPSFTSLRPKPVNPPGPGQ